MARTDSSGAQQTGQASPARARVMSAYRSGVKSRGHVYVAQVIACAIRTRYKVGSAAHGLVRHHGALEKPIGEAYPGTIARRAQCLLGGRSQIHAAQSDRELGLVDLQIASDHREHQRASVRALVEHRLERLRRLNAQIRGQRVDGGHGRASRQLHGSSLLRRSRGHRDARALDIGRIATGRTGQQLVLAVGSLAYMNSCET